MTELLFIKQQLEQINGKLEKLNHFIEGDLDEPGLKVRLDRLEQAETRRGYYLKTAISTAIGSLVTAIIAILKH
jgi:hypothetical protein